MNLKQATAGLARVRRSAARWKHAGRFANAAERTIARVNAREEALLTCADDELRRMSRALRFRAQSGEKLGRLVPEAFALVSEAARRTLGLRHYDVQLEGGLALARRRIAEMHTGEGKTLTASLALYLYALAGRGAQLATTNDYLARRDAETLLPVYRLLGLSVGIVESTSSPAERRAAYACDVTYGTAKEFGFDFLRDRLQSRRQPAAQADVVSALLGQRSAARSDEPLQRPPHFVLVDEADSILIDEAGTPLVIALPSPDDAVAAACFQFAAAMTRRFEPPRHFVFDPERRRAELTVAGRMLVRGLARPAELGSVSFTRLYAYLERALAVERTFQRDRHYVVRDGKIEIVDEFTGRIAEGRQWRDGIHQAVEAREGVTITPAGGQAARVTVQDFFLRYPHLSGMSGTAASAARELKRIYRLGVSSIRPNRPPRRRRCRARVFGNQAARQRAVVAEVARMHALGRPVLIGTRSIDRSWELSRLLAAAGIEHAVLNAHQTAEEAAIIAQAGQRGAVTVATNMAGRGTDIKLARGVAELGGLHVIMTEMHESARIDRQLIGRCGRQGDPGSWRAMLAMDDELIGLAFGPRAAARAGRRGAKDANADSFRMRPFSRAQSRVERQRFRQRRLLLYHERQRAQSLREMGLDPHLDTAE